jgi:hypothetical protein
MEIACDERVGHITEHARGRLSYTPLPELKPVPAP